MSGAQGYWRRWGVFNAVGALGFAVQLAVLFALRRGLGINYLVATAIAVEIAVLHNFVWHERLTWADVIAPGRLDVLARLLRFHVANGLISIAGNVALTWALVESLRLPYLVANAASVIVCSGLNFLAGDRFVFRRIPTRQGCRQGLRLLWFCRAPEAALEGTGGSDENR